ncbi:MAG: FadR family transcriptional regulator [Myxococcales bacterium]|nr:FadR family transcriptional regulator [Myxococcales bacterium]
MHLGLEPVSRSSLSDAVFDQLCAQILARRIDPGSTLPPERELATALGVNRGAIREALKRLAQAGLVEQRHGGGTFVLDYRRSGDLGLLSRLLTSPEGDPDLLVARSIMEMRAALAPDIARLCAERATAQQKRELEALVQTMREVLGQKGEAEDEKLDRLQLLSLELWDLLVQGSENIAYRLAFNTLRRTYEQIREALVLPLAAELRSVERCAAIVAAVGIGDGRRAQAEAQALIALGSEGMDAAFEWLAQLDQPQDQDQPEQEQEP